MVDVFTRKKRSEVMSRIRGSENRDTELRLISIFRRYRVTGWRRRTPIFGKPDFVFPKEKLAVFVDGCFWHGCPKPKHSGLPKSNVEFWTRKFANNVARDRLVTQRLKKAGWRVLRVWECDLVPQREKRIIRRLERALCVPAGATVVIAAS
jgi:DNA mismatch endonuclease (patch repair protein)